MAEETGGAGTPRAARRRGDAVPPRGRGARGTDRAPARSRTDAAPPDPEARGTGAAGPPRRPVPFAGAGSEKARRHARILQLVATRAAQTQEDIAAALEHDGFAVTQATVSRDIRELRLVKAPAPEGGHRYVQAGAAAGGLPETLLRHLFGSCVTGYDHSESIVVLSTLPGTAQSVAEAVDGLGAGEVIGTLSGERTVFVVVKPKSAVPRFLQRLRRLGQRGPDAPPGGSPPG